MVLMEIQDSLSGRTFRVVVLTPSRPFDMLKKEQPDGFLAGTISARAPHSAGEQVC